MFGDASFDYKNRISNNTNIAPSWFSINSFSLTNSFVSDDFFGMMDNNEGAMSNADKLDIAVGRILTDTPQGAEEMVRKIELYYKEDAYGSWRNNFLLISDDVDKLSDKSIQETTDFIAEDVKQSKPFINVKKFMPMRSNKKVRRLVHVIHKLMMLFLMHWKLVQLQSLILDMVAKMVFHKNGFSIKLMPKNSTT